MCVVFCYSLSLSVSLFSQPARRICFIKKKKKKKPTVPLLAICLFNLDSILAVAETKSINGRDKINQSVTFCEGNEKLKACNLALAVQPVTFQL